jgi:ubiquinone/menaquinone biosynthesis C-methylase UbiE
MDNEQKQHKYAGMFEKGDMVLELGCGGGDFLRACFKSGIKACGVDRNPAAVEGCRTIKSDTLQYLDAEKDSMYEGVYARHFFEHFNSADLTAQLKNIERVLKPGGRLVAILPNRKNIGVATAEFWKDPTHVWPYSVEELKKLIESAGMTLITSGHDLDSWDNSAIKRMIRSFISVLNRFKNEPPDYFIMAEKMKKG